MEQNIYITKYALSSGILEKEARIEDYGERGCVKERRGKAAKKN